MVTDMPSDELYTNDRPNYTKHSFMVMDRNIGATRADRGTTDDDLLETFGLYYQWGRKDPYPVASGVTSTSHKTLYKDGSTTTSCSWKTQVDGTRITTSINNPTTFYQKNPSNAYDDWLYFYKNDSAKNIYLWGCQTYAGNGYYEKDSKTIYDPCPVGYRVGPGELWNNFTAAPTFETSEGGYNFKIQVGSDDVTSWYPAAGSGNGTTYNTSRYGYYWGSNVLSGGKDGRYLSFSNGSISNSTVYKRYNACSVRCIREQ